MTNELACIHDKRLSAEEIAALVEQLQGVPHLQTIIDAVPVMTLLLNEQRQVLSANQAVLTALGVEDRAALSGRRPGEVLRCVHANDHPEGCGMSEYCRNCGALQALIESIELVQSVTKDARISIALGGRNESLDLRVTVAPLRLSVQPLLFLVSIVDISHEKRRHALERVFLHDLLNSVGAVRGLVECLVDSQDAEARAEIAGDITAAFKIVLGEIEAQRELVAAENNELQPKLISINCNLLLREVVSKVDKHRVARWRKCIVDPESCNTVISSDQRLLGRILFNLLKNAFEATPKGAEIRAGCRPSPLGVEFWVYNQTVMPLDVQRQVFQRSFSTKGQDRGLGTYSAKLLLERYLGGKISFSSAEGVGTTFKVQLPLEHAASPQGSDH